MPVDVHKVTPVQLSSPTACSRLAVGNRVTESIQGAFLLPIFASVGGGGRVRGMQ